jgi:hypothetical protein
MQCPSPWFDHWNNMWWGVQNMKLMNRIIHVKTKITRSVSTQGQKDASSISRIIGLNFRESLLMHELQE